jgi:hypothetical protein
MGDAPPPTSSMNCLRRETGTADYANRQIV